MVELHKDLHDNREDLYKLFEDQNTDAISDYYHTPGNASNQDFKMEFAQLYRYQIVDDGCFCRRVVYLR